MTSCTHASSVLCACYIHVLNMLRDSKAGAWASAIGIRARVRNSH